MSLPSVNIHIQIGKADGCMCMHASQSVLVSKIHSTGRRHGGSYDGHVSVTQRARQKAHTSGTSRFNRGIQWP